MTFYKDRFGEWHKEDDFLRMAQIFGPAFPDDVFFLPKFLLETGCIREERQIGFPCPSDYLMMGMKVDAIKCYREIHKCTLMEARAMVEQMEKDMEG